MYGAAGGTNYDDLAAAGLEMADDPLFLTGIALVVAGLAFKASVAPFHQWTPDVYEGAPTPVTGFMAVATKAAAFGVILRLFDVALISAAQTWAPAFATLAVITIVVGNVGAIGQSSLKRMLAYSSVAQAGYMLAGVVVTTRLGIAATVFYLAVYVVMNLAAFAVIIARERETDLGDDISSLYGLGADRPLLAWPMTIAMLALAGFPATAGFFGKIYLINAAVDNGYAWLGIVIVIGSAISLAYYLRVVAAVWMRAPSEALVRARPVMAGGSTEADDEDRAAGREPGVTPPRSSTRTTARSRSARAGAPRRGGLRRRRVRGGHDRPRRLSRAAVRRRPRRRRSHSVLGLALRGRTLPARPYGGRVRSSHRRPGLARVRRRARPHSGRVRRSPRRRWAHRTSPRSSSPSCGSRCASSRTTSAATARRARRGSRRAR